jgi:hypothetical protein
MPPLNPRAQQNEKQTEKRKSGRDNVREEAEVGIAAGGKEVQGEQQYEREETSERDDQARQTQPIAEEAESLLRFWKIAAHNFAKERGIYSASLFDLPRSNTGNLRYRKWNKFRAP